MSRSPCRSSRRHECARDARSCWARPRQSATVCLRGSFEDRDYASARRARRSRDHECARAGGIKARVADAIRVTRECLDRAIAELWIPVATKDRLNDLAGVGAETLSPRAHALRWPFAVLAMRLRHVLATGDVRP